MKTIFMQNKKSTILFNRIIVGLVILNSIFIIMETEYISNSDLIIITFLFNLFFALEYLVRLFSNKTGFQSFIFNFHNIIDFVAIFPPLILILFGYNSQALLILRLLIINKIFHHTKVFTRMFNVLKNVYLEICMTFVLMFVVLIISCVCMFYAEHDAQPEVFNSLSSTIWWGIVTLTTVGYGDMFPITILGKIIAGIVSILGIGVFAIPSGLIGASFIHEIQSSHKFKNYPVSNDKEENIQPSNLDDE